jgi:hypothetical protein
MNRTDVARPPKLLPFETAGLTGAPLLDLVSSIWDERASWIHGELERHLVQPESDRVFLIEVDQNVVGVTGYYSFAGGSVGLCWHGVTKSVRGTGVSRLALEQVRTLAAKDYPDAEWLIELIPADRLAELDEYFVELGFSAAGGAVTSADFDWLPPGQPWYVYRLPLCGQRCE